MKPSNCLGRVFFLKAAFLSRRCLRFINLSSSNYPVIVKCLRMPSEVPIFSQGKYETGCMPSRYNEYESFEEEIKASWNPSRTEILKHQCRESHAIESLEWVLLPSVPGPSRVWFRRRWFFCASSWEFAPSTSASEQPPSYVWVVAVAFLPTSHTHPVLNRRQGESFIITQELMYYNPFESCNSH